MGVISTNIPKLLNFRFAPRLLAILYAVLLILSSLSIAIRENKPSVFLIDGVGQVLAGSDKELSTSMDAMVKAHASGIRDWYAFLNILGALLLFRYIFAVFYKLIDWSFEMASPLSKFLWAVGIIFLLQTIFYTATTGSLYIGYNGLVKVALHLDSLFFPVMDFVTSIGGYSARSPIV